MFDQDRLRVIPDNIRAGTLKDVIEQRCRLHPERAAVNFLHDGELATQEKLSYGELDAGARAILAQLRLCAAQGERAVLLFPAGNHFLLAFVACLYGGVVAVPVAFPGRRELDWQRVVAIVEDCGATVILSTGTHLDKVESRFKTDVPHWRGSFIDAAKACAGTGADSAVVAPSDLAFLQYTSGSTGAPKGVMVDHANLMHNQRVIQTGYRNDASTRYVSWLPLFHDLGLIACALQSFYLGVEFIYMAPAAFLQRPMRWIEAISHFRATTSGGPNFAFELCAARYESASVHQLDLSAWQCAFNGAEPVRKSTLSDFYRVFAPHGLAPTAQYPCYGLAEAVLLVSGEVALDTPKLLDIDKRDYCAGRISAGTGAVHTLVGVGRVVGNQQLRIVDPDSCLPAAPGTIGEVWLCGPSVAAGYWKKADETEATFRAQIVGEQSGKHYLRTGDSGYIDHDGELYITGRIKDTIIINGSNYFPQDIELLVESLDEALKPGGGAVFSVEHDDHERIVVLQEVTRTGQKTLDAAALIRTIRQQVASKFELNVFDVCLLKPTTLLKTTSGKVQRRRNKAAYLDGKLSLLGQHRSSPPAQQHTAPVTSEHTYRLVAHWIRLQPYAPEGIDARDLFVDAGVTSVDAVSLAEHLSVQLATRIDASMVWEFPEIGSFCEALASQLNARGESRSVAAAVPLRQQVDVFALDEQAFNDLLANEFL